MSIVIGNLEITNSVQGFKSVVNLATTTDLNNVGNGTWVYAGSTLTAGTAGLTIIDGVTVLDNYTIMVKDQATSLQNGVYAASNTGVGSQTVLTRITELSIGSSSNSYSVWIRQGTINGLHAFVSIAPLGSDVIGTNDPLFTIYDVVSTLSVSRGGSGTGAFIQDNLLIGSGTGPVLSKALLAGSNISISTSSTSISISGSNINLFSAGGTSLVFSGSGPNLSIKGLTQGNGISFQDAGGSVAIINTSLNSLVNLFSTGGSALVVSGSGPNLSIRGLIAATGINFIDNGTSLTIVNTNSNGANVNLFSAGGTSLVFSGSGPNLSIKGLTQGTGISFQNAGGSIAIINTSLNTSVNLFSNGGTLLVVNGSGPNLTIKGLIQGTGISFTDNNTGLIINTNLVSGTGINIIGNNVAIKTGSVLPYNFNYFTNNTTPYLAMATAANDVCYFIYGGTTNDLPIGTFEGVLFQAGTVALIDTVSGKTMANLTSPAVSAPQIVSTTSFSYMPATAGILKLNAQSTSGGGNTMRIYSLTLTS